MHIKELNYINRTKNKRASGNYLVILYFLILTLKIALVCLLGQMKVEQEQQYQTPHGEFFLFFSKVSIAPELRKNAFGLHGTLVKTEMREVGHLSENISLLFWALHWQHHHFQLLKSGVVLFSEECQ